MENNKSQLRWKSGSLFNPFAANFPLMEKPGSWFTPAKCLKNTFERVIFYIKMQVNYLHLYLKCSSSSGVFHTFHKHKSTTWFLHNRNIGLKWVNSFSIPQDWCPHVQTILPALLNRCHHFLIVIAYRLRQLFLNSRVYLQIK